MCLLVGTLLFTVGAVIFFYPGPRPYQTDGVVVVIAGLAMQILGVVLLAPPRTPTT